MATKRGSTSRCFSAAAVYLLCAVCLLPAGRADGTDQTLLNQLADNASPYLELHKDDPVAWQVWDSAVMEKARQDNKLVFISVGYFSCHWCHVMQRESFSDPEIGDYINRHFVPVKVDRELDPALDARLIDFAERTQGRAGWPLNAFVTPEGDPLFTLVYAPPRAFLELLEKLHGLWEGNADRLSQLAARESQREFAQADKLVDSRNVTVLKELFERAVVDYGDIMRGGFGDEAKFPQTPQLQYLIEGLSRGDYDSTRELMVLTLDSMANLGLYDHIEDGFFRYTADPDWEQPHFEKMLYENAMLARLYLHAARVFPDRGYDQVAYRVLDFMIERMTGPEGGMISSFSAVDDAGVDGGYYLYSENELQAHLDPPQLSAARIAMGFDGIPNHDAGFHVLFRPDVKRVAESMDISPQQAQRLVTEGLGRLADLRQDRNLPVDGKRLAAWNGLALATFSEAARFSGRARYRDTAQDLRDYLVSSLWNGATLHRSLHNDQPAGRVSLEDYAYVADGLMRYAQTSGKMEDYQTSADVLVAGWREYRVGNGWRTVTDSPLGSEPTMEISADSPMPSPTATMANVALELAVVMGRDDLWEMGVSAGNRAFESLASNPFYYVGHIALLDRAEQLQRPRLVLKEGTENNN